MDENRREAIAKRFKGFWDDLLRRVGDRDHCPKHCEVLDLGHQSFENDAISPLCDALDEFTALQELWLYRCAISSKISELCGVLPRFSLLTCLSLSGNSIDNTGARLIAKMLLDTNLEHLFLGDNDIRRDGICDLLLGAANSRTLEELEIYDNPGVRDALDDMEVVLPHCRTLRKLYLGSADKRLMKDAYLKQRLLEILTRCVRSLAVYLVAVPSSPDEDGIYVGTRDGKYRGQHDVGDSVFDHIGDNRLFRQSILLALLKNERIRVHRCRVVLIGRTGAGKTWTVNSLRGVPNIQPTTEATQTTEVAESSSIFVGDIAVGGLAEKIAPTDSHTTRQAGSVYSDDSDLSTMSAKTQESADPGPKYCDCNLSPEPDAIQSGLKSDFSDCEVDHDESGHVSRLRIWTQSEDSFGSLADLRCPELRHVYRRIFPKEIESDKGIDTSNCACYLSFWDFGGQLMYHSWYQFFFAPGMIPCVVFSLSDLNRSPSSDKEKRISEMIKYVQQSAHFGGCKSKVMLVGTGADEVEKMRPAKRVVDVAGNLFDEMDRLYPDLLEQCFLFPVRSVDGDVSNCGICPVNNMRGNVDNGIQTLWECLIRECLRRERPHNMVDPPGESLRITSSMLPCNWYDFESYLAVDEHWKSRSTCLVSELRTVLDSDHDRFKVESHADLADMLTWLASVGSIVLSMEIPKADSPEFQSSVVIIRPTWLIEIGRRLLPHPQDTTFEDFKEHGGNPTYGLRRKQLWETAIIDRTLFSHILGKQSPDVHVDHIASLFESHFIFCPINTESSSPDSATSATGSSASLWFVPSMVVFHAEHSTNVRNSTSSRMPTDSRMVQFRVSFDWLPPGLPLLVVGAILRESSESTFVISDGGVICFHMTLRELPHKVYINLVDGARSKVITVYSETVLESGAEGTPYINVVKVLASRLLCAVQDACRSLRVTPRLVKGNRVVDREVYAKIELPFIPKEGSVGDASPVPVEEICTRHPQFLPQACELVSTRTLYQGVLRDSQYTVPKEWLEDPVSPEPGSATSPILSPHHRLPNPVVTMVSKGSTLAGSIKACFKDACVSCILASQNVESIVTYTFSSTPDHFLETSVTVEDLWKKCEAYCVFLSVFYKSLVGMEVVDDAIAARNCLFEETGLERLAVALFSLYVHAQRHEWDRTHQIWDDALFWRTRRDAVGFLSHRGSHGDKDVIADVCMALNKNGEKFFFDEMSMGTGASNEVQMRIAALYCRVLAVMPSPVYATEKWPLLEHCIGTVRFLHYTHRLLKIPKGTMDLQRDEVDLQFRLPPLIYYDERNVAHKSNSPGWVSSSTAWKEVVLEVMPFPFGGSAAAKEFKRKYICENAKEMANVLKVVLKDIKTPRTCFVL